MIYKSPLPRHPREGEQRTRKRFALFPTRMIPNADTVVWLEHYEEVQQYSPGYGQEGSPHWFIARRTPIRNKA